MKKIHYKLENQISSFEPFQTTSHFAAIHEIHQTTFWLAYFGRYGKLNHLPKFLPMWFNLKRERITRMAIFFHEFHLNKK